jgi:hypothetical protein
LISQSRGLGDVYKRQSGYKLAAKVKQIQNKTSSK